MRKRIFTFMLIIMVMTTASAHDFEVGGIYYYIDGNNATVTYRGTYYYDYNNEYTGAVNIPESVSYNGTSYSVTKIGGGAFSRCTGLTSVTIPNSVTTIGGEAFWGCSGLTEVTIGNSVTTIGTSAFSGCTGLTSVTWNAKSCADFSSYSYAPFYYIRANIQTFTFGEEVERIPAYLCYGMSNLSSVTWNAKSCADFSSDSSAPFYNIRANIRSFTFGEEVERIPAYLCYGMTGLSSVTWNIKSYADFSSDLSTPFYNNIRVHIRSFTFGEGVEKIPAYLCYGMSNLTSVTIPNSVTTIGNDAFSRCTGLTSVTIPNSVTTIGSYAFYGTAWYNNQPDGLVYAGMMAYEYKGTMPNGTSIVLKDGCTGIAGSAFEGCTGLTSVTIPNSVTTIGSYAFEDCTGLTSVTIGNSVTTIGGDAFEDCTGLTSVNITDLAAWCNISFQNNNANPLSYAHNLYLNGNKVINLVIPNSVTTIGSDAFYGCTGLTSVTIPNSVTTIGNFAFYECTGLTSVTIGNSVTTIGSYAFYGCSGLTSVNITDLAAWCNISFQNNNANPLSFAHNLYLNGNKVINLVIPNSVTTIGDRAFYGCSGLTSVTIPNSVTTIGSSAFSGCTGLTSVTIPNSVTTIGSSAFSGTAWYNNQPYGLIYAGLVAYKYKGRIQNNEVNINDVIIDEGTKGIAIGAFRDSYIINYYVGNYLVEDIYYGYNIKNLIIPSSVTNIGANAFYSVDSITCEAIEPPAISESTFSSYDSHLTIPYVSSYKYHTAPYWKNFKNISYIGGSMNSVSGDTIMICRGIDSDFSVPIRMQNSSPITALQCDVSSSISIIDAVLSNSRNGGDHTLSYYNNKMLIASPTLKPFKGSDGTLFSINLHTNSTTTGKVGDITLNDILMSTTDGTGFYRQGCTVPVYMTYLIGDANGDGSVDAADYVVTCNTIALRPVTTFYEDAANVNQDSHLDVSDLVGITRIALGLDVTQMHAPHIKINRNSAKPANVKLYSHDVEIATGETTTLTIKLNSPIAYKAMQMDVTLPAGLKITEAHLSDRAGAMKLMTGENEGGSTRLVASTMGDGAITAGDGVLLTLTLAADSQWSGDGTISLDNIIAATPLAERHEIEGININATGSPSCIGTINNEDGNSLVDVYNLNGQLVKTNVKRSEAAKDLPAGYYIIGEEKVYVK